MAVRVRGRDAITKSLIVVFITAYEAGMRLLGRLAASCAHYVFIEKRLLHRLVSGLDASRNIQQRWRRGAKLVVLRNGQRLLRRRGHQICILGNFYVCLGDL